MNRQNMIDLATKVIELCRISGNHLIAAESMTGGLLISELTNIPNASQVIDRSFIVYSDQAKEDILNVDQQLIQQYSVYSTEVVQAMLDGLTMKSNADIRVAISGIAGPTSYNHQPVGRVYIGIAYGEKTQLFIKQFSGTRLDIRQKTVIFIFETIIQWLEGMKHEIT